MKVTMMTDEGGDRYCDNEHKTNDVTAPVRCHHGDPGVEHFLFLAFLVPI